VTATAPPRPPRRPDDPVRHGEFEALVEALIKEARQRARRRGRRYGALAALTVLVAFAVFTAFGRTAESQSTSPALFARTTVAGAGGSKLAFISEPLLYGYCGTVHVMNANGRGQHRLNDGPTYTCAQELYPTWSPDGRKLLFANDARGIYVVNADGTERRRLTRTDGWGSAPTWSPDGRTIAFARVGRGVPCTGVGCIDHRSSEVQVMNADGSGLHTLTRKATGDGNLAWSPDGQRIAFVSRRDGNLEVYSMNADGSGQRRLTRNNTVGDSDPVWSPDSQRIAFVSNWQVYVMKADGTGQRRLTRNGARNFTPAWSPDGHTIAFERRLGRRQYGPCHTCGRAERYEIHVMNADGSGPRRLTRNGMQPVWSPDGTHIAFVSERDGQTDIYVMSADGSEQRNLTRTRKRIESLPAWSAGQTE
jgi:Tol biopolymer transport system component